MSTTIETIQKMAARLLEEEKVEMVIGYKEGTVPMMTVPWSITKAADVEQLTWNSYCTINMANYLMDRNEKIGIIAKGCDSRSVVNHIGEGKVKRENVVIIGVPCEGMVDSRVITNLFGSPIEEVTESDATITVKGDGKEESFDRAEVLRQNCKVCVHKNPVLYDELATELVDEPEVDRYQEVEKVETLDTGDRWDHFEKLVSTCIRCYACRDACPTCYCPTCFVDEAQPQWVGKTDDESDVMTFHILRAFHTAGRCTDCGACASSCPMGIDMRAFTKKLEKDCLDLWDWEAGMTTDERPALERFQPDDPEEKIK